MQITEQSPTFKYTCPGAETPRQVFFFSTHLEPSGSLFLPVVKNPGKKMDRVQEKSVVFTSDLGFDRLMGKLSFPLSSRSELNRRSSVVSKSFSWKDHDHA
jgi:hypothetical protein